MFNIGGPEVLVILVLALIVLGPQRLPDAARQIGKFMGELRRMSSGFQQELRSAMDDPVEAVARERGRAATTSTPPAEETPPAPPTPAKKAAPRRRRAPLKAAGRPGSRPTR